MTVIGEVENRICIIVDDMCDTAGTLCKAADLLIDTGRDGSPPLYHTRCPFRPGRGTDQQIQNEANGHHRYDRGHRRGEDRSEKIRIVPTAPVFAQAILNVWNGTSVSSLFDRGDALSPIYEGMYAKAG